MKDIQMTSQNNHLAIHGRVDYRRVANCRVAFHNLAHHSSTSRDQFGFLHPRRGKYTFHRCFATFGWHIFIIRRDEQFIVVASRLSENKFARRVHSKRPATGRNWFFDASQRRFKRCKARGLAASRHRGRNHENSRDKYTRTSNRHALYFRQAQRR